MKVKLTLTLFLIVAIIFTHAQPPVGYYNNAAGKTCADLKTTLKNIITAGMTPKSYAGLWTQYAITDLKPRTVGTGSSNVIYDIYSSKPGSTDPYQFTPTTDQCGSYSVEGDCYNREHSVPLSWFNGNTGSAGPATDYLHIFPTDGVVNGRRANYIYGEVATPTWTSMNGGKLGNSVFAGFTGNVFEPVDSFKGDVARAFFYFVTRYEDDMASYGNNANAVQAFEPNTFPSIDISYLELMIRWHYLDPISKKEIDRNNGAYSFQHNRNPFIDSSNYVDLVWNNSCPGLGSLPVDVIYFGGKLSGEVVKLNWTVENEILFDHYEVERSFNGTFYSSIGQVKAINAKKYSFTDNAAENRGRQVFYRLKKVDKDGKFSYTQVLTLHIPLNTKFTVYPNPATTYMQLQLNGNMSGKGTLQVTDITGKMALQQSIDAVSGTISLSTSNLVNGTYFVKLLCNGEQFVQRVVVMK